VLAIVKPTTIKYRNVKAADIKSRVLQRYQMISEQQPEQKPEQEPEQEPEQ
jgi:hypothetical protein